MRVHVIISIFICCLLAACERQSGSSNAAATQRQNHGHTLKTYSELVHSPDAAEALAWLREAGAPDERTITGGDGKGWRGNEALAVVKEFYDLGAVRVMAVEIGGRTEKARQQDASTLIIELPGDSAKRAGLFKWEAKFAREQGWDPTSDHGQEYMLIWRD